MEEFMSLRQMQEDYREARVDLEVCQCCVTCLHYDTPRRREPCKDCFHSGSKAHDSKWIWRLDRKG